MANRHHPLSVLSLPHTQIRCTVTMQACLHAQVLSPLLQAWLHMASMRMLLLTWASAAAQTHAGWQVSLRRMQGMPAPCWAGFGPCSDQSALELFQFFL